MLSHLAHLLHPSSQDFFFFALCPLIKWEGKGQKVRCNHEFTENKLHFIKLQISFKSLHCTVTHCIVIFNALCSDPITICQTVKVRELEQMQLQLLQNSTKDRLMFFPSSLIPVKLYSNQQTSFSQHSVKNYNILKCVSLPGL